MRVALSLLFCTQRLVFSRFWGFLRMCVCLQGFNPSFANKKTKSSSIANDDGYLDANLNHDDGGYLDTNCDPNLEDGVYDSRTHAGFKVRALASLTAR